jgi:DNA polymerase-3 subunit beta
MKFEAQRKELIEALKTSSACVSNRAMLPVLANALIKLEAEGEDIEIICTDMVQRIRTLCNVVFPDLEHDINPFTIPAKKLLSLLNKFTDGKVTITTTDNGWAEITCGTATAKLPTLSANDFPEYKEIKPEISIDIESKTLCNLLKKGAYAHSLDDSRKVLKGALFDFGDYKLSIVSTDGKRLAIADYYMTEEQYAEVNKKYIITTETIAFLSNLNIGVVTLNFCNGFINVQTNTGLEYSSKLQEGNYPNYKQIIPKEFKYVIKANSEALRNKLSAASVIAGEGQIISFILHKEILEIKCESEHGSFTDCLKIENKCGIGDTKIMLNSVFVDAVLSTITDEEFALCFNDVFAPIQLTVDIDSVAIIMPIRK